jgi:hypothetical protein
MRATRKQNWNDDTAEGKKLRTAGKNSKKNLNFFSKKNLNLSPPHQQSVRLAGCSEKNYCWLVADKPSEQFASVKTRV